MDDDKPALDQIKQIAERLNYLETVARDTAARLYAIETRMGWVIREPKPNSTHPPQGPPPSREQVADPPPKQPTKPATPDLQHAGPPPIREQLPQPHVATADPRSVRDPHSRQADATLEEETTRRSVLGIRPPQGSTSYKQYVSTAYRKAGPDLEARIGGNWFNRIGIIAICFGVAFFLKYAFDNEWIGPRGRVSIGVVIGLLS